MTSHDFSELAGSATREFSERAGASRGRSKLHGLVLAAALAAVTPLGCNAVLGIEEATLCGGEACDGGVPSSIESAQPSNSRGIGGAASNGADASDADGRDPAPSGELGVPTELDPGSSASPNSGSGNGNSGSGNSGSGNSGAGGESSGPGGGEGLPPAQAPASACAGHPSGDSFCMGSTRINCGGDGTPSSLPCSSADHCAQATDRGCAACLAGEARCEGAVLRVCNDARNGFNDQPCASASLCNQAQRRCEPACAANEARCAGSVLQTCNATQTGFDSRECGSPPGCNPNLGRCNFCTPDARRCADAITLAVCEPNGQSEVLIGCGVGETCSNEMCQLLGLLPI